MASGDQLICPAQPCRGACLYVLQLRIFQLHCLRLDPGLDTDSESQNHSRTACRVQACATPQILVSPQWRILQVSYLVHESGNGHDQKNQNGIRAVRTSESEQQEELVPHKSEPLRCHRQCSPNFPPRTFEGMARILRSSKV